MSDDLRDQLWRNLAQELWRADTTMRGGLAGQSYEAVAEALLPLVAAYADQRAATALRDAAHHLDDGDDQSIEVALGGAAYVHRVLCDRAEALDPTGDQR